MAKRNILAIVVGGIIALGVGIGIGFAIWGEQDEAVDEGRVVSLGDFGTVKGTGHPILNNDAVFF